MRLLKAHLRKRALISLGRREIDALSVQGFVAGLSESLLALEYVYDFQIDGLLVLRRSDVSEIRRTETDKFQERLLSREGIVPGKQQPAQLKLKGWRSVLEQLSGLYPIMVLERELGPEPKFAIGNPVQIAAAEVELRPFSGTGKWSARTERFKYSEITSLQANSRYANFYQRFFQEKLA